MEKTYLSQIETPTVSHVERYPEATKAAIQQDDVFWTAEELGVEKDEQDFRTALTEGELHGVLTLQSILTQYEMMIGGTEMWGGKIAKMFPRPEIDRMCVAFTHAEICSHAPLYKIGNEILDRATDEFYTSWQENPTLAAHIEYIESKAMSKCPLEVTASLAFLEGVVLFSAFAFFKSFNANGFNLIQHFVSGIDASAKDENFHSMGSAWLFNTCRSERRVLGNHSDEQEKATREMVYRMARDSYAHEATIIDLIFSEAPETIRTITKEELLEFVRDRTNIVLGYLGYEPMFPQPKGNISKWFYKNLSSFKYADFFAATQIQYVRNWGRNKLGFNVKLAEELS